MPRGDQTGPRGAGAMTGRGMGYCAGYDVPGFMNPGFNPRAKGNFGFGRGMGGGRSMGMGRGRGNRYGFYMTGQPGWARGGGWSNNVPPGFYDSPAMSEQEELSYLKSQAKNISQTLQEINSRIETLSKSKETQEKGK